MEQILITRANGTVELLNSSSTVSVVTKAEQRKAFLGEDIVAITVESAEDRGFGIGDKIKLFGLSTYKINQIPRFERKSERKIVYDLTFEGLQYDLIRVVYRNEDVSSFNTTSNFTLVGDIEMYLNVLINNANRVFGAGKWQLGDFPENTETKNLLFNGENCLAVLNRICTEYGYGFVIEETLTNNILHIRKVGVNLDYSFQYGKGKGLYSLSRQRVDSKNIINTLYVYGSDKNIPYNYKNYSERLRLGLAMAEPVLMANDSISAFGTFEGVVIFDDIFPNREASVTGISLGNKFEFTDSTMFDLNEVDGEGNTKYLIPGNNAKIHFNSGNLSGYEFEVEKYVHSTKTFTVKQNIDPKGLNMPSLTEEAFQIQIGDKYVIIDIAMPSSYITEAEARLEAKAEEFLLANKVPTVQYSLLIDEIYLASKSPSKNVFEIGDTVQVKDFEMLIDSRIKIVGFSRDVLFPYRYQLTISENPETNLLVKLSRDTKNINSLLKDKKINDVTRQKQDSTINTQIVSQIDEQLNRKADVKIGRESGNISLGNEENKTLVQLLGGALQLGSKSMFYEYLVTDGDGNEQYNVGIDAWNVHFEGGIEVVDVLSVGQGAVSIQKRISEDGLSSYAEIGGATYIDVTTEQINILNTLGVNEIVSVTNNPIEVNSEMNFNFPIFIADSEEPNSAISRTVLTQTIENLALAQNYWKVGGNIDVTGDMVFDIVSAYDNVGGTLVQQSPYDYFWKVNGANKMQLTAEGNLSVGGVAPEAVIHAHATVVGNAEVISLKVTNQSSDNYFSIGINSENSRTNLYASGEVWATTISKFKFGAADVSGLWSFSVIPQISADATLGNQLVRLSQVQALLTGGFAVSTTCKLLFDTNQSLAGAKTQGGYTTVTGDSILLMAQSTASQNGVYVFDGTNWARNTANDTDAEIRNKGHLVTNGTFANTQWVNNNSSAIEINTTAITYVQWSGAELDPIWEAYKTANDLTPTRFGNWNTAFAWGNHANLYVDKTSAQNNIAGAKVFTTSIQSTILKAGTDALNITLSNISGTAPRIASNSTLDFFATTRFDWLTNGSIGRMRLTTSGLRVGDNTDPTFRLHVSGTSGFDGLISVGNTAHEIAMSSGSVGQFLRRSLVSNGFYDVNVNNWATITTADVSGLSASYQAKLNGVGFVRMDGETLSYELISEFGRYLNSSDNGSVLDAPIGASYVAGLLTGLPNELYQGHSFKLPTGEDRPDHLTYMAFGLPDQTFDNKIYLRGVYGSVDTGWKAIGGDIATHMEYRADNDSERELLGYYYEFTKGDKAVFAGIDRTNGTYDILMRSANNSSEIINDFRNYISPLNGRWYYQNGTNEAKKYLLEGEVAGGSGTTYTLADPLYFVDTEINIRVASASQNGVLTAAKFTEFEGKLGQRSTILNTNFLNFASGSALYFGQDPSDIYTADARINAYDFNGNGAKDLVLYTMGANSDICLITKDSKVQIKRSEVPASSYTMFIEAEIGQPYVNSQLRLQGVNYRFYVPSSQLIEGQRFVLQYNSTTNTLQVVPE